MNAAVQGPKFVKTIKVERSTKRPIMRPITALMLGAASALQIAITGSSQGIGLDAAKRLIAQGHQVYHCCRSAERAAVAVAGAGGGVPVVCDLADLGSVRSAVSELIAKAPRLDVLCLNAAVSPSTKATVAERTAQGFEITLGTNHIGHFLLAQELLPALSASNGLLVVTASSVHDPAQPGGAVGGKGGATLGDLSGFGSTAAAGPPMVDGASAYDGAKVYKDSKLANVLFAREAFRRWGGRLRVRSFNPGFIPTSGLFRAPRWALLPPWRPRAGALRRSPARRVRALSRHTAALTFALNPPNAKYTRAGRTTGSARRPSRWWRPSLASPCPSRWVARDSPTWRLRPTRRCRADRTSRPRRAAARRAGLKASKRAS